MTRSRTPHRSLWQISVITLPEAEEPVAALLERLLGRPASAYYNAATGSSMVSVYCQRRQEWTPAKRNGLVAGLNALKAGRLNIGRGRISLTEMRRENWAESWKRHFKPIEIGAGLLIKPGWSRRRPRAGQAMVVLDPGLSFGTGQHPTTAFCLRHSAALRQAGRSQSFLDIGTGSGIVAIAAAKLGYSPVHAFDSDPDAVRIARSNAARNRELRRIRFSRKDLTRLPLHASAKYDFVCANLAADLLLRERRRIANRLRVGGMLALAGVLRTEFGQVQHAYERLGFRFLAGKTEQEWCSGVFQLRGISS